MNLPDLRYQCLHCGYSCQGLEVELSDSEARALSTLDAGSVQTKDGRQWLRKEACGSCHFLLDTAEARCGLHRAHGLESKPNPCRQFPFRVVQTPGGSFLGASFACRAIVERHGPSVDAQTAIGPAVTLSATPLAPGLDFDWDRYTRWEANTLERLREQGQAGLWTAALEVSVEVLGGGLHRPTLVMEDELQAAFRGLLALAEGPMTEHELLAYLSAFAEHGECSSRLLAGRVHVGEVLSRWQEPWPLWSEAAPFFEHLLFRKYLLEGPDVHARLCSLPVLAQILQFLTLARSTTPDLEDFRWALRLLEERLTFHARGLGLYLGRCGRAFLDGLQPVE